MLKTKMAARQPLPVKVTAAVDVPVGHAVIVTINQAGDYVFQKIRNQRRRKNELEKF